MGSYLMGKGKDKPKRAGIRAEKDLSRRLGGRLMPASGAMNTAKGDINLQNYRMESKSTQLKTMKLERGWLEKIAQEAVEVNKEPALAIQFTDVDGKVLPRGSWVMITETEFRDLMEGN